MSIEWFDASDMFPPEDVPVWCLDKAGGIFIGGYVNVDEGWAWTNCYHSIYHMIKDGKWVWCANDFEWDDDYEVIRWAYLPEPPRLPVDEEAKP